MIEPCKSDTETWIVKIYDANSWTTGSFKGFGNIVENKDSSMIMEVTDINLDGVPDKPSSGNLNTMILLGYGDGTFDKITDSINTIKREPLYQNQ